MLNLVKENTVDYCTFMKEIVHKVKDIMGEGYSVQIFKVTKNNSLELDSLVVLKKDLNYAPNIYLMPYYEAYLEGTTLTEIVDRICCIYQECAVPIVDKNFNYSLEEMKPFIVFRLINYDQNMKLLKSIPHIRLLDLAITFHCLVRNDEDGIGSIRISNEHLDLWDTTVEEVYDLAKLNTKKIFPASIRSMDEVILGMLQEEMVDKEESILSTELLSQFTSMKSKETQHHMYILSNQKGINGASCLIYDDVIRQFSNLINSDLFILPSSIHEVILVPNYNDLNKNMLTEMVRDVNRTQVAVDEVLSDKVYYYSRDHDMVEI